MAESVKKFDDAPTSSIAMKPLKEGKQMTTKNDKKAKLYGKEIMMANLVYYAPDANLDDRLVIPLSDLERMSAGMRRLTNDRSFSRQDKIVGSLYAMHDLAIELYELASELNNYGYDSKLYATIAQLDDKVVKCLEHLEED